MVRKGAIVIEGHVQGLSNVRSLGELCIPVYVVDSTHCLASHSKYCKKFFVCPSFSSDEFVPFLVELAKREGLSDWLLMASNDIVVEQLACHKTELDPYYKLIVPDRETLLKVIDKNRLNQIAQQVGIPVPSTCESPSVAEAELFRFPVLIKGRKGLQFYKTVHKKAIRVENYQDLIRQIALMDEKTDCIIQEEILNHEKKAISFTCFSEEGVIKAHWIGVKLREHPAEFGTATFAESILLEGLLEKVKPLITALNYSGICEIEFMFDEIDGCYKLIEINPRTWLWVGLAKACGCDYAKMLYRYAYGTQQEFPKHYEVGMKWVNAMTDLPYSIRSLLKRKLSISDYLKSFKGKVVHAVWDWNDIAPGLVFPFMAFHIWRTRK